MSSNFSLVQMAKNGELVKTGVNPKLPITLPNIGDGTLEVYRIPLDYLYYNNENGRIASAISRYGGNLEPSKDSENPEYNQIIQRMIVEDNPAKLNKTRKSIKETGQKVCGYVLADGRVIDGNRRYTALRQLAAETGETYLFEAVILPFTFESKNQRTEIKRLELAIQMGTEERVTYDPVDLSVDIYQTIVIDKLMTERDYKKESKIGLSEIKNRISTVMLMNKFLEFINAEKNSYHIIKDANLYNPLYEVTKSLDKQYPNKGIGYEQSKITAFALLTKMFATGGDTVREIRSYFNSILTTQANDEFNYAIEDSVDMLRDNLEENRIASVTDFKRAIDKSSVAIKEINTEYNRTCNRQSRGKNIDNFIDGVQNILSNLTDIKKGNGLSGSLSFNNFSKEQINDIKACMIQINAVSEELIDIYENEI